MEFLGNGNLQGKKQEEKKILNGSEMEKDREYEIDMDYAKRKVMGPEEDEIEVKLNNSQIVDEAIENINVNMPEQIGILGEKEFNKEAALNDLDNLFEEVSADHRRAALFYKVRDAVEVYRNEENQERKGSLLFAVREAAANYLIEKTGEAVARKRMCKDIIKKIDTYVENTHLSSEDRVNYLLSEGPISDKQLDMEILIATAHTRKQGSPLKGDLKDRRKAFNRKIKDVRQVNLLKAAISNDSYVTDTMEDLTVTQEELVDIDKVKRLDFKYHKTEKLLLDMLSWNIRDFEFSDPGDFVNRVGANENKTEHFKKLYRKLSLAEKLSEEVEKVKGQPNIATPVITDNLYGEVKARLAMFKEIKKEYDNRLDLMESPYYALTLQEDTKDYDTDAKRNALVSDKPVPGTTFFKKIGSRFKSFIGNIGKKLSRLTGINKTGGEFTRGTNAEKLLKWHRRRVGAAAVYNPRQAEFIRISLLNELKNDLEDEAALNAQAEQEELEQQEQPAHQEHQEVHEQQELQAEQEQQAHEGLIAQEENRAREKELQDLKKELTENSRKKVDDFDKEEHKRIRENLVLERKQLEEAASKAREKELTDIQEKLTKNAAATSKKLDAKTELKDDMKTKLFLESILEKYQALSKPGADLQSALSLKESMANVLSRITGVAVEYIEFTPSDRIIGFISYTLEHYDEKGMKEKVAKDIKDADAEYSGGEGEEALVERAAELLKKGEKMTVLDKLLLYDHNALLIAMNRNPSEEEIEEAKKEGKKVKLMHYGDFRDFDEETLTRYARQISILGREDAGEDEKYEELDAERQEKLYNVSKEILMEHIDKESAYFDILPLRELVYYATNCREILDKKLLKDTVNECKTRLEELHENRALLVNAGKSSHRKRLYDAITHVTGIDAKELDGLMIDELVDTTDALAQVVYDKDLMKQALENSKTLAQQIHTIDYYELRKKEIYKRQLEETEETGKVSSVTNVNVREYTAVYLNEKLGLKGITMDDYKRMNLHQIHMLDVYVDIIMAYRETPPADEYEKEDLAMAIRTIGSYRMTKRAKEEYQKVLNISFEEKTAAEKAAKTLAPQWEQKPYELNAKKSLAVIEEERALNNSLQLYWNRAALKKNAKKEPEKKIEMNFGSGLSDNADYVVTMFADLIDVFSQEDSKVSLKDRVKAVLKKDGLAISLMARSHKEKGTAYIGVFKEIKKAVSPGEAKFFAACEESLSGIMNEIFATESAKANKFNSGNLTRMVDEGKLDKAIDGFIANLPSLCTIMEKEVISVMEETTRDIYGTGKDEEDTFPSLLKLMGLDEEQEKKEEKKADKKAPKSLKKSEEERLKERAELEQMENKIRFDPDKGQGKFVQTMITNYYRDSSTATKRKMLSYIIRDTKKETEDMTDRERGYKYLASAVKGAGPLMHKMLQGVPERMVVNNLHDTLNVVKSSLEHISDEYVAEVISKIITDSKGAIKSISDLKSLGAASVAETFSCTITDKKNKQQSAVIKILRPDAYKRMMEEEKNFMRYAMYADMTEKQVAEYEKTHGKTYNRRDHDIYVTESGFLAQYSEIQKEFNFVNEANNCEIGVKRYVGRYSQKKGASNNYNVKSVVINQNAPKAKNYLIMDKAEGITADRIIQSTRDAAKNGLKVFKNHNKFVSDTHTVNLSNIQSFWDTRSTMYSAMKVGFKTTDLVGNLAYVWLDQALFGNFSDKENFHHGDLHAGNIMVDTQKYNTTVLDYGNAVMLTTNRINCIINMTTAVAVNRADSFVNAFNNLLTISAQAEVDAEAKAKKKGMTIDKVGYEPLSDELREKFEEKVHEIFKKGDARDSGKKILVAMNVAQQLGIKLPKEIQTFSQCQQRLENTLMDSRDATIRLCKDIITLDTLPVSEEDKGSIDPLIQLHEYRSEKLKSGVDDSDEIIQEFKEEYNMLDYGFASNDVGNVTSQKSADTVLEKYFPLYKDIKKTVDPKLLQSMAQELKTTFEKVEAQVNSTGNASEEDFMALEQAKGKILVLSVSNPMIAKMSVDVDINEIISQICKVRKIERDAFERIYALLTERIPALIKVGDKVMELAKFGKKKMDDPAREKVREDAALAAMEAISIENKNKDVAITLRKMLRTMEQSEFERQTARMRSRSRSEGKSYLAYRSAEADYKAAKKSGSAKLMEKAQKAMKLAEEEFVRESISNTNEELRRVIHSHNDMMTVSRLENSPAMADFSSIMGTCCYDNLFRCACKLELSLSADVYTVKDITKLEEATEKLKKTYEEARKFAAMTGDKKAKKAALDAKKAYESKMKDWKEKVEAWENKQKEREAEWMAKKNNKKIKNN
ncbi:MAG: hypothetical protein K6A69_07090 [Lachnospiraceae bacterium]|nr:hypothetical protein [Lachnospiraceae bacterium]